MIKILRYSAIVLAIAVVLATSCSNNSDTGAPPKSFLWVATSNMTTVYVLGSVHMAKEDLYPLNRAIEDAYDLSQNLVVEIDLNSENIAKTQRLLMEKGMYPTGDNLRSHINEGLYSRLKDRLKEFDASGLLLYSLNMFEPWVVAITIADLVYMKLGYDVEYGIETYFLDKAEADDKDVLELESVEFQLDIFDSLPDELQLMMLEDAIDEPVTEEVMDDMFDAWSTGDTARMEELLFEGVEDEPEYELLYQKIIDERNFQMLEKIENFLEDNEIYFVVVGAGHLIGDNGIINLLDGQGYEVSQR